MEEKFIAAWCKSEKQQHSGQKDIYILGFNALYSHRKASLLYPFSIASFRPSPTAGFAPALLNPVHQLRQQSSPEQRQQGEHTELGWAAVACEDDLQL